MRLWLPWWESWTGGSLIDIITFWNQPVKFHDTTLDPLACTTCFSLSEVHWPCLCRPSLAPFKATKLCQWPTYGNHLALWKLNYALSLVHLCTSECRGRWSRWIVGTKPGLWNRVMGLLPPENSNLLSVCVGKWWKVSGLKVVVLLNEDFGPCTVWHKKYSSLSVDQHREFELTCEA